jgi:DNA polymerase I
MLVIGDYKHLEWDTCVYLSQDKVAIQELFDQADMHSDNQQKFGLPSRLLAKIFLFRLIFGGTAPSYAHDPDFTDVSCDTKFWQGVIDNFYLKYGGVNRWHNALMVEAMDTGKITLPTGLFFPFKPYLNKRLEPVWPRTKILNYPVQGLGAQLMVIARVLMRREMQRLGLQGVIICTVHDSILIDCPDDEVEGICKLFHKVWSRIPEVFYKMYDVEYNLPCLVEVKYGPNWGDMKDYAYQAD